MLLILRKASLMVGCPGSLQVLSYFYLTRDFLQPFH